MKKMSFALQLVGLLLLCVMTHLFLIPVGMGLLNSDFGIYPITADWIGMGHWTPFQVNYTYGGVPITVFRVPWVALVEKIWGNGAVPNPVGLSFINSHILGHLSFNYMILPLALTASFFYMARQFGSWGAALLSGVICAVGFNSWLFVGIIDFYNVYLIFGAILLGIRVHYSNPLKEMKPVGLFLVSIFAGIAYYGCRASVIYIAVFFLPWEWIRLELRRLFQSKSNAATLDLIFISLAGGLLVLYAYLMAFGGYLGQFRGHAVKLHAGPNLNFAAVALAIVWIRRNLHLIKPDTVKRWACVGAGFLIGMSPELIFWLGLGKVPPLVGGGTYSFEQTLTAVGKIPASLAEILGPPKQSFLIHGTMALLIWSWVVLFKKAKTDRKARLVIYAAALSLLAYVRVMTYALAPPRYLLPIFPALVAGFTLFFDEVRRKKSFWVALVLVFAHLSLQITDRFNEAAQAKNSKMPVQVDQVIQAFRKEQVRWVISDEYWESNQYTFASNWNPFFVSVNEWFHLPFSVAQTKQADRVGILLAHENQVGSGQKNQDSIHLLGSFWKLSFIKKVNDLSLYVGTKVNSPL